MTADNILLMAGPYIRLGWRPNGTEGMRFLATAVAALIEAEEGRGRDG
jgi:hypothetical protein